MSRRISRRIVASALLAGSLGLFPVAAGAAPVRASGSRRAAVASQGLFGSLLSQLVRLWAADSGPGNSGTSGNPGHGGPPPRNDEGPGLCPHGH